LNVAKIKFKKSTELLFKKPLIRKQHAYTNLLYQYKFRRQFQHLKDQPFLLIDDKKSGKQFLNL